VATPGPINIHCSSSQVPSFARWMSWVLEANLVWSVRIRNESPICVGSWAHTECAVKARMMKERIVLSLMISGEWVRGLKEQTRENGKPQRLERQAHKSSSHTDHTICDTRAATILQWLGSISAQYLNCCFYPVWCPFRCPSEKVPRLE